MNDYLLALLRSQAPPGQLMAYAKQLVRSEALLEFNQEIMNCQKCDYCSFQKAQVLGSASASILLLLPYPDDQQQAVLNYLNDIIAYYKIPPEQFAVAYTVYCKPLHQVQDAVLSTPPTEKEIQNCLPNLKQILEIIEPQVIFCMSSLASHVFTNQHYADCLKNHGYFNQMAVFTAPYPGTILTLETQKTGSGMAKHMLFCEIFEKMLHYISKNNPESRLIIDASKEEKI